MNQPDLHPAQRRRKLSSVTVQRIREAYIDLQEQGVAEPTSRQVAEAADVSRETCKKYIREVKQELAAIRGAAADSLAGQAGRARGNNRRTGGRAKRDLISLMEATAENFAEAAHTVSRSLLAAAREGGALDVSVVQLETALGISLDKLALMRREEQSQIYQRVLKESSHEVLEALIKQQDAEIQRLLAVGMVSR